MQCCCTPREWQARSMAAYHLPLPQASTYVASGQSRFEGDLEKECRSCRPALALWKLSKHVVEVWREYCCTPIRLWAISWSVGLHGLPSTLTWDSKTPFSKVIHHLAKEGTVVTRIKAHVPIFGYKRTPTYRRMGV